MTSSTSYLGQKGGVAACGVWRNALAVNVHALSYIGTEVVADTSCVNFTVHESS